MERGVFEAAASELPRSHGGLLGRVPAPLCSTRLVACTHQRRLVSTEDCRGQRLRLLRLRGAGVVAARGDSPKYSSKGAPVPTVAPLQLRVSDRVGNDACENGERHTLLWAPAGVLRLRGGLKGRRRKASGDFMEAMES